jgi:hypothetical protein
MNGIGWNEIEMIGPLGVYFMGAFLIVLNLKNGEGNWKGCCDFILIEMNERYFE